MRCHRIRSVNIVFFQLFVFGTSNFFVVEYVSVLIFEIWEIMENDLTAGKIRVCG